MSRQLFLLSAIFPVVLIASVGCGTKGPKVVPVSGTVLYQGKPVEGAQVSFRAEGAARAAMGTTNAEGKFELTTFNTRDGAVPGSHKVSIAKAASQTAGAGMSAADPSADYEAAMAAASTQTQPESTLPAKYANPDTSGLVRDVTAGETNDFTIELE